MPKLIEVTDLHDRLHEHSAAWYRSRHIPKAFHESDKRALDIVEKLCGGDWRRCVLDSDGSITVYNSPVWEPELTE